MFKTYIGVTLFIIAALLAVLTAGVISAAGKLHTVADKADNFSQKTDSINATLQDIRSELQQARTSATY